MELTSRDKIIVDTQCYNCKLWDYETGCQWALENGCSPLPVDDCSEFKRVKA